MVEESLDTFKITTRRLVVVESTCNFGDRVPVVKEFDSSTWPLICLLCHYQSFVSGNTQVSLWIFVHCCTS